MANYYCEYCGQRFNSVQSMTGMPCHRHPNGPNKGKHKPYEGGEKSRYTCVLWPAVLHHPANGGHALSPSPRWPQQGQTRPYVVTPIGNLPEKTINEYWYVNVMKNLLEQAGLLLRQTELKQEEAKKRGERFNMFGACGVNHYETTHSAIIASLLDPLGSHGQGNLFLKQWLQVMDMSNVVDAETARVQTEFTTDTGRIDILIEDESHRAVIIENKIYAPDQYKQLERYDKYANDAYHGRENYKIVYLTLFGNEASPQSASDVQYVRASYARHIIDWLGVCIDKSATFPLIRETLIQYRNHIKTLTNQDMEINEKQELLKLMVEHAKEVDAIMAIANTDYGKYVFDSKVKPELEKYADSRDLICKCENLYETRGERGIFFYRPEWKGMAIRLWSSYSSERSFFWGISNYTAGCDMSRLRNKYKLKCLNGAPEDAWPYGWEYSDRYRNWDFASGTISAMCNGEFVQYVTNKVDEILKEIELQKVEMI